VSTRFNDGSHYENHPRAAELHEGAEHAHRAAEHSGQQEHLTSHEHSRQEQEHHPHQQSQREGTHMFNHEDIAALAHEFWQARGCPDGSPDVDWLHAVAELRSRSFGH